MTARASSLDRVHFLIERACVGDEDGRERAVVELTERCERDRSAPFDLVLAFFDSRLERDSADREPAQVVKNALVEARYRVARARAAVHGLTVPRPDDLADAKAHLVIDPIRRRLWQAVNIFQGVDTLKDGLAFTSPGQEAVFALTWAQSEMLLGGVTQFLRSSTGILWPEAVMGARLVGAEQCAALLVAAGHLLPGDTPARDHDARLAQCDAADEELLNDLDLRYDVEDIDGEITRCLAAYVRAHPDEFFE